MATLQKRMKKKGGYTWHVSFYMRGKHHSRSTGTADKKLAVEILRKVEEEIVRAEMGLPPIDIITQIKLSEFIPIYLKERRARKKSENTVIADEFSLRNLLNVLGDLLLTAINENHVRQYRDFRVKRVKAGTINLELRHLKSAFNWAIEGVAEKYLRSNPFKQRDLFVKDEGVKIPRCLTPREKAAFFEAIDDPEHVKLFKFYLLTGCRRNEALELQWEDIDLEHLQIVFQKTKSRKSRIVPINMELMQVIMSLDREKKKPFDYNPQYATHFFKVYARQAGLKEDVHLHCLRHTAASDLVRAGVHPMQIQKLLGHSSIKITEVYVHVLPEDLRGAAERLTCLG